MTQPEKTSVPSITKDDHESGIYKWDKKKCKVFLLHCNESSVNENGPYQRRTSDDEIGDLKECLQCWLGNDVVDFQEYENFEIYNFNKSNSTEGKKTKFIEEIRDVAENEKYDCFIFIVITFGVQDRIFCWDGEISITDILEPIKKEPSMALKPKVFFIQSSDKSLAERPVITKDAGAKPAEYTTKSVPREADVFILKCILPESLFPVKECMNECIFLTALMETVKNASTKLDIHRLSITIIAAVAERLQTEQGNRKTFDFNSLPIPEVTSTLTKALYFPIKGQF